jgi:hypothetical protein
MSRQHATLSADHIRRLLSTRQPQITQKEGYRRAAVLIPLLPKERGTGKCF